MLTKILLAIGWMAMMIPCSFAGQWSGALGDARSVQHRTEEIAERLNKYFPYSNATHTALHLDNAACQLVESVKCGASWAQVQGALQQTCSLAEQFNALVNADCQVRNDRRIRDYLSDLAKRVERLRCSLDKAFARTQPAFYGPATPNAAPTWGGRNQYRVEPANPYTPYSSQPRYGREFDTVPTPTYPNGTYRYDTYDFDSAPIAPNQEFLAPESQFGPIQYRVQQNPAESSQRTAAFAQLGIQALRLVLQNR